ncbi:MAG: potassium transporter TrkA [Acidobacteria bacterium]|nr:MAG: potassium transporter TrkA [Acidobacteriota bacterium]
MQIALVLGLLTVILILFPLEIVSVDVLGLGGLLILVATGILSPDQAFASFGSEMMVLLASIFVIAAALMKSGILDTVGLYLYRHSAGNYRVLLVTIVLVVSFFSAFMNNTVVTAVFIPPVLAVARRAQLPPSKLLMPVAFGSMLGGCCTLIGTSTNMAASAFLVRKGMAPFSLFEFLPVGLALVAGGAFYFLIAGSRLLPSRGGGELTRDYHVKEYLAEVALRNGCPFVGKRLDEAGVQALADVTVLGIVRNKETLLAPEGREVLEQDDTLLLEGAVEGIHRLRQTPGVEIKGDVDLGDHSLESDSIKLAEVMVGPGSRFVGRTLKEIDFRRRYGMTALALSRYGRDVVQKVGKIPLEVGDVLLVQGPEGRLNDLRSTATALVLSDLSHFLLERRKAVYVVGFFLGAIVLGGLQILPLGVAFLSAAVLTVLVRGIPEDDVYTLIDWRLLIVIGAMTAFGQAMITTGADKFLAALIVNFVGNLGPMGLLAAFFVLTVVLSQPLSNAAAALAVLPTALATAERIGANPRAFAVVVTLAASASFITPLEPSCVLVYPAGLVLTLVPLVWPL